MNGLIAARAPGRVNLIGDHTDYTGGLVFPMAVDRWTEIKGQVDDRIVLESDHEEESLDLPLIDPMSAAHGWGRYVAAVAQEVQAPRGIRGHVTTTIPVGAGLSSSAALELATALALGFDGTALELAQLGRRAEHRATGVPCGIMDQLCIAAAVDGHATMIDCHTLEVTQVPIPDDVEVVVRFVAHRTLEGSQYATRVAECEAAEEVIGPLRDAEPDDSDRIADAVVRRRARHVITENRRVVDFADSMAVGDYREAGELMVASHRSLAHDFETSTPDMDAAVRDALHTPGVFGARITGGGFGGCIVALCSPGTDLDGWVVRPVGGARAE